ncbi:MAG TPA: HD-GYP domain-containing protein, partial [Candidatus Krumholzibacteria bacterium]
NRKSIQEESNKVMSRAVLFVGEVMRAVEQKRPIQVSKAMRLTQKMADIIQVDESVLLGLTSIKDYDEYTFAHSVNVCVLSMAIADRMELPKAEIAEIGVAGLLHDIGKMHVPLSILNKSGQLDPQEWDTMRRHPMLGVIELSRVRSMRMITSPLFVALQHHVQYAGDGYPYKPNAWTLHRHSRIVSVADVFDAMTTPRTYRATALVPGKAVRFVHSMSGRAFDPVIVKAFVQAMGVYPVGSGVELDSGDIAVVLRQNRELAHLHRPWVAIVNSPSSEPINLAEQHAGRYRCSIVRSADELLSPEQRAGRFVTG